MNLGEILKRERINQGLTISELADAIGVSSAYISKLENNLLSAPSYKNLFKILSECNVEIQSFIKTWVEDNRKMFINSSNFEKMMNNSYEDTDIYLELPGDGYVFYTKTQGGATIDKDEYGHNVITYKRNNEFFKFKCSLDCKIVIHSVSMDIPNVATFIKGRRKTLGISLEELSKKTNCQGSYISKLEKNTIKAPSFNQVMLILCGLDLNINTIVSMFKKELI